ncbi:MAG TPA: FAD-binding and (Fe-S)-binding domain-containing protein [Spongiibacteraceae bacterium]
MNAPGIIQTDRQPTAIDAQVLAEALAKTVRGEVRFDNTSRALYATDASNYRQVPIGVVLPRDADDVIAALAICRKFDAPVLPRGGGTSLCGQCCNVAVIFDFSKYMHTIIALDPGAKTARVQPGVVLDDLRNAAEQHQLTFAPDPSTHSHNTLGGMIGNNSCGPHSVMAGRTSDNIIELDIVTYDGIRLRLGANTEEEFNKLRTEPGARGDIFRRLFALQNKYADEIRRRSPNIPRRVSGYNLIDLLPENYFNSARALVGSEGTCVLILEAIVRLVDSPPARSVLALGYADVFSAADHVPQIMKHQPTATEGMDEDLVMDMKSIGMHPESIKLLPKGKGWLLVEFGGADKNESDAKAKKLMIELGAQPNAPSMKLFDDPAEEAKIWNVRKAGLGATAHVPNKNITWEGWEDSAVPPERLGDYLRALRELFERFEYVGDLYGHFGQGCVHTRIDFDLQTRAGIEKYRRFMEAAVELVVSMGGSISGEHGDGQSKAEFLGRMYGETMLAAFREFKSIWDPRGKMNPGKVVDPYRIDENLRIGTAWNPPVHETFFRYPNDSGSFPRAMLRCVGVGECRKHDSGVMCPSYVATREEMHSTRGRARLLFEMLKGDAIKEGWRDKGVKAALDLCLSCKACRSECPVNVDMATYKAEFMAHHYYGRLRPLKMYAFGFIDVWARAAAHAPALINFIGRTPPFSTLAKSLIGIAKQRRLPTIAQQPFTVWFHHRSQQRMQSDKSCLNSNVSNEKPPNKQRSGKRVLLWPDTFNNFFHPETLRAAVEVLEATGFEVQLPKKILCCGRPLYEFGFLRQARHYLEKIFTQLDEPLREGIPIVVLEPACASVFREDVRNLLPFHVQGQRLTAQTFMLGEFLQKFAPYFEFPALHKKALVHGHCHHHAIVTMDAEKAALQSMQVDFELLQSGCCGMAGAFGFEAEKFNVSMTLANRALLPRVQQAHADTLIIADGYSCREQIAQNSSRRALHLAEVLADALRNGRPARS